MKQRKRVAAKVALGLVLVVASALAAVIIKDALAMQKPENALPVLTVYYNGIDDGQPLRDTHVRRDKYNWRFLFTDVAGGGVDLTVWQEIPPAYVNPKALLEVSFTYRPKEIAVSLMQREGEFLPVEGQVHAPGTPGVYTYRVVAVWSAHKRVEYYFKVEVPDWSRPG